MPISNAFPQDREARGLAIKTEYVAPKLSEPKGRPIKILAYGVPQADKSVASEPYDFVSDADTISKFGRKSTLYHISSMLQPKYGTGVGSIPITFFPLTVTGGDQAVGTVTPTGTVTSKQIYYLKVNNKLSNQIVMTGESGGATVADFCDLALIAVNAVLKLPVTATDGATVLTLTAGFETAAGDFIHVEVVSPDDADLTFVIVQPTGGAGTVDLSTVWDIFGENWYSHVVNGVTDATDDTGLDSALAFGTLRMSEEIHKPFKMYTGSNEAVVATVRAITSGRSDDFVNSIKHTPDSNDLPWVIASRMLAVIAATSNSDPTQDPQLRKCDFLTAGRAAYQLDSAGREQAVKDGLSTIEVIGDSVYISDSVMCYRAAGEDPPGFQKDVAIEKLCYMIYNLDLIFSNPSDAGNPLVLDSKTVTNPNARKPSYYKELLDNLFVGAEKVAVVADAEEAIANSEVGISASNGDRVDVSAVYDLTGNQSVISVNNKFSYKRG